MENTPQIDSNEISENPTKKKKLICRHCQGDHLTIQCRNKKGKAKKHTDSKEENKDKSIKKGGFNKSNNLSRGRGRGRGRGRR